MGRSKNYNREDILDKATALFWEQGFEGTSLQDLELATGVNKSGLYSEFKDKRDLYLECLKHYLTTHDAPVLKESPLGWNNIASFFSDCSKTQRGCFAVNCMRELAITPSDARALVSDNQDHLKQLFSENIKAARAGQKSKVTNEEIAEIILTFFVGFCMEQNLTDAESEEKIASLMRVLQSL